MSKLFRFLHHIYFDWKKERYIPAQAGKFAEWTVRIVQLCWRQKKLVSFHVLNLLSLCPVLIGSFFRRHHRHFRHILCTLRGVSLLFYLFCLVFVCIILCYLSRWIKLSKAHKIANLGKSKKSFSTMLLMRTPDYLRYLSITGTVTVTVNLSPHLKNVVALPCEMTCPCGRVVNALGRHVQ